MPGGGHDGWTLTKDGSNYFCWLGTARSIHASCRKAFEESARISVHCRMERLRPSAAPSIPPSDDRHVEVDDTAAIMGEHNKNEHFKPDRMHREEIGRGELRHVVMQKRFPSLGFR